MCMIFSSTDAEPFIHTDVGPNGTRTHLVHKCSFGGDGGGVPHVPIPNTTVKPSSADGTWTEGSWESRTLPSKEPLPKNLGGGFICLFFVVLLLYTSKYESPEMRQHLLFDFVRRL